MTFPPKVVTDISAVTVAGMPGIVIGDVLGICLASSWVLFRHEQ